MDDGRIAGAATARYAKKKETILAAATDDQMPAVSGELASAGGAETGGDAGDESDLGHG